MSDQQQIEDFALFLAQYFDATEQDLFHIGQLQEIIEAAKVEWLRIADHPASAKKIALTFRGSATPKKTNETNMKIPANPSPVPTIAPSIP